MLIHLKFISSCCMQNGPYSLISNHLFLLKRCAFFINGLVKLSQLSSLVLKISITQNFNFMICIKLTKKIKINISLFLVSLIWAIFFKQNIERYCSLFWMKSKAWWVRWDLYWRSISMNNSPNYKGLSGQISTEMAWECFWEFLRIIIA